MRSRSVVIVVGLFCLVSSVASASAECAWVLWRRPVVARQSATRMTLGPWEVVDALKTKDECDRIHTIEAQSIKGEYVCLPDTVDPRGPKGK